MAGSDGKPLFLAAYTPPDPSLILEKARRGEKLGLRGRDMLIRSWRFGPEYAKKGWVRYTWYLYTGIGGFIGVCIEAIGLGLKSPPVWGAGIFIVALWLFVGEPMYFHYIHEERRIVSQITGYQVTNFTLKKLKPGVIPPGPIQPEHYRDWCKKYDITPYRFKPPDYLEVCQKCNIRNPERFGFEIQGSR